MLRKSGESCNDGIKAAFRASATRQVVECNSRIPGVPETVKLSLPTSNDETVRETCSPTTNSEPPHLGDLRGNIDRAPFLPTRPFILLSRNVGIYVLSFPRRRTLKETRRKIFGVIYRQFYFFYLFYLTLSDNLSSMSSLGQIVSSR